MVSAEYGAAISHLTLDPADEIVANLFLSSAVCPIVETWKQATTNITHRTWGNHLGFLIEEPPLIGMLPQLS